MKAKASIDVLLAIKLNVKYFFQRKHKNESH